MDVANLDSSMFIIADLLMVQSKSNFKNPCSKYVGSRVLELSNEVKICQKSCTVARILFRNIFPFQ